MNTKDIREEAKYALKGKWGLAIALIIFNSIIPLIITALVTPRFGSIFGMGFELLLDYIMFFLFTMPLVIGLGWVFLGFVDRHEVTFSSIFDSFKNFWNVVFTSFLIVILLFLWSMLAAIPSAIAGFLLISFSVIAQSWLMALLGILVIIVPTSVCVIFTALKYSQAYYLLKDYTGMRATDIIKESKTMMQGNKKRLLKLELSFVLYYIPCIVAGLVATILFIQGLSPLFGLFGEIFALAVHNPSNLNPLLLDWIIFDTLDQVTVQAALFIGAGILVLLSVLYSFAISFYVLPLRHASAAVFYRNLNPRNQDDNPDDFELE